MAPFQAEQRWAEKHTVHSHTEHIHPYHDNRLWDDAILGGSGGETCAQQPWRDVKRERNMDFFHLYSSHHNMNLIVQNQSQYI